MTPRTRKLLDVLAEARLPRLLMVDTTSSRLAVNLGMGPHHLDTSLGLLKTPTALSPDMARPLPSSSSLRIRAPTVELLMGNPSPMAIHPLEEPEVIRHHRVATRSDVISTSRFFLARSRIFHLPHNLPMGNM
jgi:hypothetical protein